MPVRTPKGALDPHTMWTLMQMGFQRMSGPHLPPGREVWGSPAESPLAKVWIYFHGDSVIADDWFDAREGFNLREFFTWWQSKPSALVQKAVKQLDKIVVADGGQDDGVILLSDDSPSNYDEKVKAHVYEHEYFSPLGDALVRLKHILIGKDGN